eukprot:1160060-Pelagomonas_calceolata.AAC.2
MTDPGSSLHVQEITSEVAHTDYPHLSMSSCVVQAGKSQIRNDVCASTGQGGEMVAIFLKDIQHLDHWDWTDTDQEVLTKVRCQIFTSI